MGLSVALGFILGVAGIGAQIVTGNKAAKAQKKAEEADKRAQQIQTNREKFTQSEEIRKRVRQKRIKAAQIQASSEAGGTQGSSAETGGLGSLSSKLGDARSFGQGGSEANQAISQKRQQAAGFRGDAKRIQARGELFQAGIQGFRTLFS